jgi:hypothetical protein
MVPLDKIGLLLWGIAALLMFINNSNFVYKYAFKISIALVIIGSLLMIIALC